MVKTTKFMFSTGLAVLLFSAGSSNLAAAVEWDIASTPVIATVGVPPNLMFILDDSGSMDWSYLPDGNRSLYTTNRAKSSVFNPQYYDPEVNYVLPVDHNGDPLPEPSFTDAWDDGYRHNRGLGTTRTNLSNSFRPTWYYAGYVDAYAHNDGRKAYYYVMDQCSNANSDSCYSKVEVGPSSGPGGADERQNFANWYSYYRTRMFASRAAIGRAFSELPNNFRLGWGRINKSTSQTVDGKSVQTLQSGVRGMGLSHKKSFYDWLYSTEPTGNTPLHRSLYAAGEYFDNTSDRGPWSTTPGQSGGEFLACRQSFTILMTDGYYNQIHTSVGNEDGNAGSVITSPSGQSFQYSPVHPFRDNRSNTLADIAMRYWKKDLLPGVDNQVPTNSVDPAFWQHMTTYTIGLGVRGNIDPDKAFEAIETGENMNWPNPNNDAAKIDDMLHAAVNGRGGFFSVDDPDSFAKELALVLQDIIARADATSSGGTDSVRLDGDSLIYQAVYDSFNWSGDVIAESFDGSIRYKATERLPSHSDRKIFTYNGNNGVEFTPGNVPGLQASLINYIRGDDSLEGDAYRMRESLIGDIIGSELVFSGPGNEGWGEIEGDDGDYFDYIGKSKNDPRDCSDDPGCSGSDYKRKDTVFVGANDGMLHAFDGRTMDEFFAYVPSTLQQKLDQLADPDYGHEFYVDGQIAVGDARIGGSWGTYLVGTLGAGGKGVYALDVTDPESFSASDVLWELDESDFGDELGYTFGQPAITRLESGEWVAVFGNGYNSKTGQPKLFIVDLEDGSLLHEVTLGEIPDADEMSNGLSGVSVWEDPGTRSFVRRIYAGDLKGTMWRVDFDNGSPVVRSALSDGLFTDPEERPITVSPTLGDNPAGGIMVYFGTGKLFSNDDQNDETTQVVYGILDINEPVNESALVQNTKGIDSGSGGTVVVPGAGGSGSGWFLELLDDGEERGERVIYKPDLRFGTLVISTTQPESDPCVPGTIDRAYTLDAITGGGKEVEVEEGSSVGREIVIIPPDPPEPEDDPGRNVYNPGGADGAAPTPPDLDAQDLREVGWCSKIALLKYGDEENKYEVLGEICDGRGAWRENIHY